MEKNFTALKGRITAERRIRKTNMTRREDICTHTYICTYTVHEFPFWDGGKGVVVLKEAEG